MTQFKLKSKRPIIIAGPCSAETEEQVMQTCTEIAKSGKVDVLRAGVWKPRTSPGGFEGAGLPALGWMSKAREATGLPIAVEIATAKHAEAAMEYNVDIIWIGARTTGNPFSVQEIANALKGTNATVLVKNPMNPDINLWAGAIARLKGAGIEEVGLIHRGFSSYGTSIYRNNPMWHLAIEMRKRMPDVPMFGDPSHICGNRELLQSVSQKSADLFYDGLIIESHINPAEAWSDASQQLTPADLEKLLDSIKWRQPTTDSVEYQNRLAELRQQIDQIDSETFELLGKRMDVAREIGQVKKDNNVAILQGGRWGAIVEGVTSQAGKLGVSEDFLKSILEAIHIESINIQNKIMNE